MVGIFFGSNISPGSHALRKSAVDVAEGSGKSMGPGQRRFYAIARGSTMECAAIIDACRALSLIDPGQTDEAGQLLLSTVGMLSRMCRP